MPCQLQVICIFHFYLIVNYDYHILNEDALGYDKPLKQHSQNQDQNKQSIDVPVIATKTKYFLLLEYNQHSPPHDLYPCKKYTNLIYLGYRWLRGWIARGSLMLDAIFSLNLLPDIARLPACLVHSTESFFRISAGSQKSFLHHLCSIFHFL